MKLVRKLAGPGLVLGAYLFSSGCGSSSSSSGFLPPLTSPTVTGSPTQTVSPTPPPPPLFGPVAGDWRTTVFLQQIDSAGPRAKNRRVYPTSVNHWDLAPNFVLEDGGNDAFDGFLQLNVEVDGSDQNFPNDQERSELVYRHPLVTQAEGLAIPTVADEQVNDSELVGNQVCHFPSVGNVTGVGRRVDLRGLTGPVNLAWDLEIELEGSYNIPDFEFRTVLRNLDGTDVATLATNTTNGVSGTNTADLTAYIGQELLLSFELVRGDGSNVYDDNNGVRLDDVSLSANAGPNLLSNGDFEQGIQGWTAATGASPSFVESGMRVVSGVEVKRSFFTRPGLYWGRSYDTFRNPTGAPQTVTVRYESESGVDGDSPFTQVPGSGGRALTVAGAPSEDPDSGLVYGNLTVPEPDSESDEIEGEMTFTLQPGETRAVVHFTLQDVVSTQSPARAANLDTVALDILTNLRTSGTVFLQGLTEAEVAQILNF